MFSTKDYAISYSPTVKKAAAAIFSYATAKTVIYLILLTHGTLPVTFPYAF